MPWAAWLATAITLPSCNCALDFPEVVASGGNGGDPGGGGAPTAGGGGTGTTMTGGGGMETSVVGGGMEGGGGATGSTLCTIADEFDGEELDRECWTELAADETTSVAVDDGQLTIIPTTGSGWWNDEFGYFLHREVTGAFAVVARVNATGNGSVSEPPVSVGGQYLMAGLLVRAPNPTAGDGETWIKLELGYRSANDGTFSDPVGVLGGLARDGQSGQLQLPETTEIGHRGLLGLCRAGNALLLFSDLDETAPGWVRREDGNDEIGYMVTYPTTMQVGLLTGIFTGTGQLRGIFDYIRIAELSATDIDEDTECMAVLSDLARGPGQDCDCP